jgi:aspartate/methionine/tyrosine aminotransferase
MLLGKIRELDDLSALESLAEDYEKEYGWPPFDLSHWDPSVQNTKALLKDLRLPMSPSVVPYIYSGDIQVDFQQQVIERLGLSSTVSECSIVPTGTSAILFAAWWLRAIGVSRVIVVCPVYFPVLYACEMANLPCTRIYMRRHLGNWHLPEDEVIAALGGEESEIALWITNPIYCTGQYLGATEATFINSLLDRGIAVVADECLSINGKELSRQLSRAERFVGIYCPHKSVCINAVKFAAIVFNMKYRRFFTDWSDVLVGGLSSSNYVAVLHFLDENFTAFQSAFTARIASVRQLVTGIVHRYDPVIQVDAQSEGYFMTCYVPGISATGGSSEFLRHLVFGTGAIMIPGYRNHFSPQSGFNFRINLARECPQFLSALQRAIAHLAGAS